MRALVISGGGSKGAFAGGVADYLINEAKRDYDILVGTSTGSLLVPLLAIEEVAKLKKAYTNVVPRDIYNINPFRVSKLDNGELKTSINHFNTIRMFLKGKKTFGETKNLRKTIERVLSEEDFNIIKRSDKKVIVTVSNLTTTRVEYKYLSECSYEDFCDWMWASSSFVPFMSLVEKNGFDYADGGFGNYVPIQEAIDVGATEIDVVVLKPRQQSLEHLKSYNAFDTLTQVLQFTLAQIAYDDIMIGHLESIYNNNVKVKFFFTPHLLTKYSFYFDPLQMKQWWQEGYDHAKARMSGQ